MTLNHLKFCMFIQTFNIPVDGLKFSLKLLLLFCLVPCSTCLVCAFRFAKVPGEADTFTSLSLLVFYQHFGASGGIFPGLNTLCAIPQLFSTTPNQTSMCSERSLQIKAPAEQEGEHHKNNL